MSRLDDDLPPFARGVMSTAPLGDNRDEITYWHAQTPYERLCAVELLRRMNYGEEATSAPFQRVLEFAPRA